MRQGTGWTLRDTVACTTTVRCPICYKVTVVSPRLAPDRITCAGNCRAQWAQRWQRLRRGVPEKRRRVLCPELERYAAQELVPEAWTAYYWERVVAAASGRRVNYAAKRTQLFENWQAVRQARAAGLSYRALAKQYNLSLRVVSSLLKDVLPA